MIATPILERGGRVPVDATVEAVVVRANQRVSLPVALAPARDG